MSVKGDDVADTHGGQLFQRHGAVEGFTLASLVLAALIEKRHDDIDTVCRSRAGAYNSL